MIARITSKLNEIEVSDKKKSLAVDIEAIRKGVDIFESSMIFKAYRGDVLFPNMDRAFYDSSVQIVVAIGLVSTLSYLTEHLGAITSKGISVSDLRAYRQSPIRMHLDTILSLGKRISVDHIMDYAHIAYDFRDGTDKTFFIFRDTKAKYVPRQTSTKNVEIKRDPADKPSKENISILANILGQEKQITYLGFIIIFYYVYTAHFMMRYIESRFDIGSDYQDMTGKNTTGTITYTDIRENNVPESFGHYFGMREISIESCISFQQQLVKEEKGRARKLLDLILVTRRLLRCISMRKEFFLSHPMVNVRRSRCCMKEYLLSI